LHSARREDVVAACQLTVAHVIDGIRLAIGAVDEVEITVQVDDEESRSKT
jgi:hypothetical protein